MLAEPQNRWMFHLRRDDVALVRSRFQHPTDGRVISLCPAAREDDFDRVRSADERRDLRPRITDFPGHLTAEAMNARGVAVKLR